MPGDMTDDDFRRLLEFRIGLRRFIHWSEEQAAAAGLTAAQHQLLLAIRGHRHPAGPTVGDLAEHLLVRHHSAVGLIDRAEAAGLVRRDSDASDARIVRVALTPDGAARLAGLSSSHLAELRRLVPRLQELWEGLEPTNAAN